ncbi:hypothetical protein F5Y09DRAFT_332946 [Xylaria sp. FL1042]|nr:hypothetical protein F5Y09DRAFT_332946 [Xylaria sp. FL1042]
MDKLYAQMLSSLKRSDKELSNRLLFAVLTNPFSHEMTALCLKWLVDKDAWKSRVPQSENYTLEDAIGDIEYVIRHLDIWTRGLVEIVEPEVKSSSTFSDYSSWDSLLDLPGSPFFASRVKLFHRTARDYLLHSGFSSAGLHADLRLKELRLWDHCGKSQRDLDLYQYGYEILTAKSDTRMGGQIGECQVTWSLVREMAHVLPSECLVSAFEELSDAPFNPKIVSRSDHTSQGHFAASLGLNETDIMERLVGVTSESSPRNLLLSACLSGMGESKWADKFATVWMILLLLHETQEEVLFLGHNSSSREYYYNYFITPEELVRGSNMMAHAHNPLGDFPKYDKGSDGSNNEPTWAWECWRGQSIHAISGNFRKLTAESLDGPDKISLEAVVSRTCILEDDGDFHCFLLW